jgi:hypothetical protein
MAESTIQKFKSTLIGGGARPNLFEVRIPGAIPGGGVLDDTFSILCKASSLPASNIGMIDVPFRGRNFKVAGDRTFDEWSVTVINDESFSIRRVFEDWMNFIGQYGDSSGATEPNSYMVDAYVKQLTKLPANIRTTGSEAGIGQGLDTTNANKTQETIYKFHDIFPTSISAIDLSYDSTNTIEEFSISFQVQYWTPAQKGELGE